MLPEWHNVDTYSLHFLTNITHESSQIWLSDCQTYSICNSSWSPVCRRKELSETEWEVRAETESGWDNMELCRAQFLCPCLVLISLERQRWPCWVKPSTSRAAGLDSWPWSGRWEVTREVGVGSVYVGLRRARERGNVCMCLYACFGEIGKECLSAYVFLCALSVCKCKCWHTRPPVVRSAILC